MPMQMAQFWLTSRLCRYCAYQRFGIAIRQSGPKSIGRGSTAWSLPRRRRAALQQGLGPRQAALDHGDIGRRVMPLKLLQRRLVGPDGLAQGGSITPRAEDLERNAEVILGH